MNCADFTSSNGNRNGKRKYGAANCGARAEEHHNSSIDFLDCSVPDAAKHGQAKRGCVNELAPIFLRIRPNPGN
jgi:hypothetical protein